MDSELYVSDTIKMTENSTFLVNFGSREKQRDSLFENEKITSFEDPSGSENNNSGERKGWKAYIGLLLTLAHVLCFSLAALIIKILKEYHPFSMGIWRFQGLFIPSVILLISTHIYNANHILEKSKERENKESLFATIWPPTRNGNWKRWCFLLLRCICGTSAILLFFYSLHFISIADSMVIQSAAPVFITLLAYFWLGEPCGIFPVILSVLTIAGVIIISRPPILTGDEQFDSDTLIGSALGVGGMLLSVVALVIIRHLKDVHVAIISTTFGLWGTLQSLVLSLIVGVLHVPHGMEHILLTIAVAILAFLAQITLTSALKREEAGPVSLIRTTTVIFGFIWQFIFLGVQPDAYSLVGASVVLLGVVGTTLRKWISTLPETHICRRYLFVVLK